MTCWPSPGYGWRLGTDTVTVICPNDTNISLLLLNRGPPTRWAFGRHHPTEPSQGRRGGRRHRVHPLAAAGDQRGRTLARGTQQVGLRAATSNSVLWRHCRSLPVRKSGELTEAEKSPSCSHGLGQGLSTLHSGHSELGHPLLWGCPTRGLQQRPLGSAHRRPAAPRSCDCGHGCQGGGSPWLAASQE